MKILAVLTYYHPHWTGLTGVAQRVAEGMAARGHQVTVLTSRYRPDLPLDEVLNGVRVIRVPAVARLSRGMLMPTFPWAAARLIRAHDVVQIHTPMLEAPLLTALARRAGVRAVITHHGDLVMPHAPFDQFVELVVTALLRRAFVQADRVVVYTQDYLDHSRFLRPFAPKAVPILPPVAIPEPDRAAVWKWRSELGVAEQPLVGFAGRFVEEKGFDFLFKAIPLVVRKLPQARFAYAGDRHVAYENFYERCRPLVERVEPYLLWVGLHRGQQLANFYGMLDVLAVPSRTDNFPLVPVEAMLCGTPLVVADIPGARMAIKLTGMGRLVRARDEVALADGLRQVLADRSSYVRPHSELEAVFSLERSLDEYERALTR
ncbi:MAG: glycosyltransferase family 4 protein [Chloroflexi bacterium]|nr:glycosyltransferase family 4 protein [Chloroflexota bacterium]